jgi:hypothetical protein
MFLEFNLRRRRQRIQRAARPVESILRRESEGCLYRIKFGFYTLLLRAERSANLLCKLFCHPGMHGGMQPDSPVTK